MDPLLQHLVQITTHRDHNLLDISVVSALHELAGLSEVRLLEIFQFRDQLFLRRKVWISNGKVVSADEVEKGEQIKEPISDFPTLVKCIEERNGAQECMVGGSHQLWLPIWLNDKLISCFEIGSKDALSRQTHSVIEGILNVYRNYQSLLDYSERDSLTGLLNRKTFDEKFARMALATTLAEQRLMLNDAHERRSDQTREQWLAVVDIDHFKKVNDEFGHVYGDEVLILVANLLRSSFRSHDKVFRFGGEEFVIMLRSATLDNARKIFDRLREKVEAYHFPQVGRITVSLGFVNISSDTPVVILGHADQALYYAKEHGRNRICFYDELLSEGFLQSGATASSVEFF